MKSTILLLLIVVTSQFANSNEIPTKSSITEVVVYLSGAQITRTAEVNVGSGNNDFRLTDLSPFIDESSIQIAGLNDVSIVSMKYGINYLSTKDLKLDSDELISAMDQIKDSIQSQNNHISGLMEELEVIQKNRDLSSDNQSVSLEKIKSFTAYYGQRTTEINNDIYKASKEVTRLKKRLADIEKQGQEHNFSEKTEVGEIFLKLSNQRQSQALTLIISYNVRNAGWFPVYDISAKDISQPLDFKYNAHVYQSTGINWSDTHLILSTGDPTTHNVKTDLEPKYLNFVSHSYRSSNNTVKSYNYRYNPTVKIVSGLITDSSGQPLPGVNVMEKGTSNGTQTDFDGKYSFTTTGSEALTISYIGMVSETLPIH